MHSTKTAIIWSMAVIVTHCLHIGNHLQQGNVEELKELCNKISDKATQINGQIKSERQILLHETDIDRKIALLEEALYNKRKTIVKTILQIDQKTSQIQAYCSSSTANTAGQLHQKWTEIDRILSLSSSENQRSVHTQQQYVSPILLHPITTPATATAEKTSTNLNSGKWVTGQSKTQIMQNDVPLVGQSHCPRAQPYKDPSSQQCVSCPEEQPYFLTFNHTCVSCHRYQPVNRSCFNRNGALLMGTLYRTNYKAGEEQIILPNELTLEQVSTQTSPQSLCPEQRPFYDGQGCLACPQEQYFSYQHRRCLKFQSNQYYEPRSHHCLLASYFMNLESQRWSTFMQSVDDVLEGVTIARSDLGYKECPIDKPFATKVGCINCPEGEHFDYDNRVCTTYTNVHQCRQRKNLNFQTNPLKTENLIYAGLSLNQWSTIYYQNIDNNPGISDCPEDVPYFDSTVCITCSLPRPYFNLKTRHCQACSGVTIYDASVKECLSQKNSQAIQTPSFEKMASVVLTG